MASRSCASTPPVVFIAMTLRVFLTGGIYSSKMISPLLRVQSALNAGSPI